jgi:hypothetical protein
MRETAGGLQRRGKEFRARSGVGLGRARSSADAAMGLEALRLAELGGQESLEARRYVIEGRNGGARPGEARVPRAAQFCAGRCIALTEVSQPRSSRG